MGGLSFWHVLILAVVAIIFLGGGRFSNMMGDVAKGIKSFKKGMAEDDAPPAAPVPPSRIESRPAAPTIDGEPVHSTDRQV